MRFHSLALLGPVTKIPHSGGGTHSLLLPLQSEEQALKPQPLDPREKKSTVMREDQVLRVKAEDTKRWGAGGSILSLKYAAHWAGVAHSAPALCFPPLSSEATIKALKTSSPFWWPQNPAQHLAQSKHTTDDCEHGCSGNYLQFPRGSQVSIHPVILRSPVIDCLLWGNAQMVARLRKFLC